MESRNKPTLADQVKALRARAGMTLKDMSKRTGIPVSTLSKVEHGALTLTYDKLLQLSERMGIPISELFAEQGGTSDRVTARRSVGTVTNALQVETPNYDYFYLCTELRQKRMVPIITRIRAKSVEEFGELVQHAGEEFIYVLNGSVHVHTEFYDPLTLRTGESVYIDSNMGHAYLAAEDCDEAVILAVCASSDKALMESLMGLHDMKEPGI
jgi:transcriptional regulator with XRE-family HTH domain